MKKLNRFLIAFYLSLCALALETNATEKVTAFETPSGLFPAASQRALWEPLVKVNREKWIKNAEEQLAGALPPWSDDLYLEYSKTGERGPFGRLRSSRDRRFYRLFLGELAEYKGRFIPALEEVIADFIVEKSWVLPAHDGGLRSFNREIRQIDLLSALRSFDLAMAVDIFARELDPDLVRSVRQEIHKRTIEPYLEVIEAEVLPDWFWWMKTSNNWNAVCHFGVIGSGLIVERDPKVREQLLEGMQRYLPRYLSGFGSDGYCSEGLSYWNYGFAQYAALAELVRRGTDGKIDLLDNPEIEPIALYPFRLQLAKGVYPIFADASLEVSPLDWLTAYLSRRFTALKPYVEDADAAIVNGGHIALLCFGFAQTASTVTRAPNAMVDPLRSVFPDGGVIISRSGDTGARTAVALKAGHNGEHHNHNDVGSFVIAVDGVPLVLDPGKEVYRQRTFGPNRYDSQILNSFGHSVPVVAGALQSVGKEYYGEILSTAFSDSEDRARVDLSKAYAVKELQKLERSVTHSREKEGSVEVVDTVVFSEEATFSEVLITFGEFRQTGPGRGEIIQDGVVLECVWEVSTGAVEVTTEKIEERLPSGDFPLRIEFSMTEAISEARFSFVFRPVQ